MSLANSSGRAPARPATRAPSAMISELPPRMSANTSQRYDPVCPLVHLHLPLSTWDDGSRRCLCPTVTRQLDAAAAAAISAPRDTGNKSIGEKMADAWCDGSLGKLQVRSQVRQHPHPA
jgi:hypothetical protein